MENKKAAAKRKSMPSTAKNLSIAEIKNDTIILRDGTLRAVLIVSSVNFALKSEEEQNAIVEAYVGFLNTLEHPLQVVVQSRELYIKPYLDKLAKQERTQTNELLRAQIVDYRAFVAQLVEMGQIMSKHFFVTVPYNPLSNRRKGFWSRFAEIFNPANIIRLKEDRFLKRKNDLDMRVRQVVSGLRGMGLEVAQLDTQSLIELMYSTYNPDIALTERMAPMQMIDIEKS